MSRTRLDLSRRNLLKALLGGAAALPFAARSKYARGDGGGRARRLVVFYFPDGVPGRSQDGQPSLWNARAEGGDVALGEILAPLGMLRRECVFLNGLSMGGTDEGSHPGGAKKLLTGRDGGNGESVDQFIARTVANDAPFRHLYLGAMATQNNASGDKFISYPSAGVTVAPEDDPLRAFSRIFSMGMVARPSPAAADAGAAAADPSEDEALVLDNAIAEVRELRGGLDDRARTKLDVHLDALSEVRGRVARVGPAPAADAGTGTMPPAASCENPRLSFEHPGAAGLVAPASFPAILRAQIDVTVQAMACGLSRVGVIQGSQHTSELIMSRFRDTEMFDAGFDMRSHQASHYGARQDRSNRLFTDFLKQRRWWVSQFAYLLEQLRSRPEGDGTMLDHSLVLLCSEVSDGNTHSHQDMPFILAGRGGGCVSPGRVLDAGGRRHGDLLAAIARAMGASVRGWGDGSSEALPGLLTL